MVIETDILPISQWLLSPLVMGVPRLAIWAVGMLLLFLVGIIFSYFVSAIQYGPVTAFGHVGSGLAGGIADVLHTSPRRVFALSWLAYKESIRRKVVWAFGVFSIILAFAGWYLDSSGDRPAHVYLNFVMTSTWFLILVLSMVLSSFSIPTDIRDRTIFTVVSKPVRRHEIILGRFFGFVATGTVLLACMGFVSYWFVVGGLSHTHSLHERDLAPVTNRSTADPIMVGRTPQLHGHSHEVKVYAGPDGKPAFARTDNSQGHYHEISIREEGSRTIYEVHPSQGMLVAREALYGRLTFRDRSGQEVPRGINVGNEWEYRSFIEGGTKAAAIWRFEGVNQSQFPDGLPIELTLRVFRTFKGRDIKEGILGSILVRNPETKRASKPVFFECKEYFTDVKHIPQQLRDAQDKPLDLFKDLVQNGKVEVEISCAMPAQYFGMAQYDVYLRVVDRSFAWNFVKGYIGIWLRMTLVIGFGVMFSTFLRGSVAMLAVLAAVIAGLFVPFMLELAKGKDGPVQAMIRIVSHQNEVVDLDPSFQTTMAKMIDSLFTALMNVMVAILPDLSVYDTGNYVANGFDIPLMLAPGVLGHALTALAYLIPMFWIAHFTLRAREVAQ